MSLSAHSSAKGLIMSRRLLTITPSIVACARDYLHHSQSGTFVAMHIAECFALPSDQIVAAWDDAEFELRKRGQHHEFELVAVAVFKDGRCVAEYRNRNFRDPGATLLAGLDD